MAGERLRWQYFHDAGIQRVHDKYTWQRTAEGYLAVIEGILEHQESIPAYFRNPSAKDVNADLLSSLYLDL